MSQDRQPKIQGPSTKPTTCDKGVTRPTAKKVGSVTRPTTCQMGVTRPSSENGQPRNKTDNLPEECYKTDSQTASTGIRSTTCHNYARNQDITV